jgi:hypothetical protein
VAKKMDEILKCLDLPIQLIIRDIKESNAPLFVFSKYSKEENVFSLFNYYA